MFVQRVIERKKLFLWEDTKMDYQMSTKLHGEEMLLNSEIAMKFVELKERTNTEM